MLYSFSSGVSSILVTHTHTHTQYIGFYTLFVLVRSIVSLGAGGVRERGACCVVNYFFKFTKFEKIAVN
jgi:hypothetical protein